MRESRSTRPVASSVAASAAAAILVSVPLAACSVTRAVHHGIEVKHGASIEERARFAQAIATEERLQLLKEQIAARMSGIAREDLDGAVGLRWFQFESRSGTGEGKQAVVGVRISVRDTGRFDSNAVLRTAVEILEPEINRSPSPR